MCGSVNNPEHFVGTDSGEAETRAQPLSGIANISDIEPDMGGPGGTALPSRHVLRHGGGGEICRHTTRITTSVKSVTPNDL